MVTDALAGQMGKRYGRNSRRRRRSTFKEWLFCEKNREKIPKSILIFYVFQVVLHLILYISWVIMWIIGIVYDIGSLILPLFALFDSVWVIAIGFLFRNTPKYPGGDYTWLKKNKRKK